MILINQAQWNKNIKESIAKNTKLEPEFKESIAENNMLRKHRLDGTAKKEKTINNNFLKKYLSIQAQVTCTKI